MLPLLLLLFYGAAATGTAATIKWMADGDDIPSTPSRHEITERTTVLTHYPGGRVVGNGPSSGYEQYRSFSAAIEEEMNRKVRSVRNLEGWNESKITQIVKEHLEKERQLQREYANAIAAEVNDDDELIHKYFWAWAAKRGIRF